MQGKDATSPNTAYTAHFVRLNFGFAETSYMLEPLYDMTINIYLRNRNNNGKN